MGHTKQTFLISGTADLSAHRVCLVIEVVLKRLITALKGLIGPAELSLQTFLFSGTVELSAHRMCLAVEVVHVHCQLT